MEYRSFELFVNKSATLFDLENPRFLVKLSAGKSLVASHSVSSLS